MQLHALKLRCFLKVGQQRILEHFLCIAAVLQIGVGQAKDAAAVLINEEFSLRISLLLRRLLCGCLMRSENARQHPGKKSMKHWHRQNRSASRHIFPAPYFMAIWPAGCSLQ